MELVRQPAHPSAKYPPDSMLDEDLIIDTPGHQELKGQGSAVEYRDFHYQDILSPCPTA